LDERWDFEEESEKFRTQVFENYYYHPLLRFWYWKILVAKSKGPYLTVVPYDISEAQFAELVTDGVTDFCRCDPKRMWPFWQDITLSIGG
jgi:hypothetical protein